MTMVVEAIMYKMDLLKKLVDCGVVCVVRGDGEQDALKQTIYGDFNHVSVSEVKTLMEGDASGRVQR